MPKISRETLLSLETYSRERNRIRAEVIEHKRKRRLALGVNVTLIFEDEQTMRYQVQEMLRVERIFEDEAIAEELGAYNPLIPDGSNWKATMMIEYPDPAERAAWLKRLVGIEDRVWMQVEGPDGKAERLFAIADEDLDRSREEKTAAVHFLRFELPPAAAKAVKAGAKISAGVDHPQYQVQVEAADEVRASLAADLA